jgi:hypothetical protein
MERTPLRQRHLQAGARPRASAVGWRARAGRLTLPNGASVFDGPVWSTSRWHLRLAASGRAGRDQRSCPETRLTAG